MFQPRFPAEVLHHHINPVVRYLVGEINKCEREIFVSSVHVQRITEQFQEALKQGVGVSRLSELSRYTALIVQAETARIFLYSVLGEVFGSLEETKEFLDKYPPRGEIVAHPQPAGL